MYDTIHVLLSVYSWVIQLAVAASHQPALYPTEHTGECVRLPLHPCTHACTIYFFC